jgi:hypothetical protein
MKRAERPISNLGYIAMLHRIEMDIVHVPLEIGGVPDGVLPITPLPKPPFTARAFALRARCSLFKSARKSCLDQTPAQRVVVIPTRQRPQRMQVIRQNADCDGFKWIPTLDRCVNPSQSIDLSHQKIARSVGERHREEIDSSTDFAAAVSRHTGSRISPTSWPVGGSAWARFALPTLRAAAPHRGSFRSAAGGRNLRSNACPTLGGLARP